MELLVGIFIISLSIIGAIVSNIVANALYDGVPSLSRWLLLKSCRHIPHKYRDRYEEEWLAHLHECAGKLSQLIHAFDCYRAAHRLKSELRTRSTAHKKALYFALQVNLLLWSSKTHDLLMSVIELLAKHHSASKQSQMTPELIVMRYDLTMSRYAAVKSLWRIARQSRKVAATERPLRR